ncbi:MAG TPA: glycosyltransferase family 39 protein [bacterium]|jgi:hypothetical protein|nr:glycosyltransferase family 39 protein [bacterium]
MAARISKPSQPTNEKYYYQLGVFIFLMPGFYTLSQGYYVLGVIFLLTAGLLQVSLVGKITALSFAKPFGKLSPFFKNGLVWFLLLCLGLATLSFSNYSWAFQRPVWFPFGQAFWLQLVLFIGLIGAFLIFNPKEPKDQDISSWTARIWFWAIVILAAFMRIYRVGTPEGSYGFDEAGGIMAIRLVRDLQDYQQGYYIAYYEKPLTAYITLFFWHWLPAATDLYVGRVTSIACDMVNILLLYLIGKEIGGRRTGVLAAGIGAISKPLLNFTAMAMGGPLIHFLYLWPILISLRLFKKPDLRHFLQLGLTLSIGLYAIDYVRITLVIFTFCILGWLLSFKENRKITGPAGWLVLFNVFVLGFYYFYMSLGFSHTSWIHQLFSRWRTEFLIFMTVCCVVLAAVSYLPGFKWKSAKKNINWINALLGFWICTILDYPQMTQPDYLERTENLVVQGGGAFSGTLAAVFAKLISAGQLLFWYGSWPANMGVVGDAMFSLGETVIIFAGLAYLIARPKWDRIFIFILVAAALLPHVLVGGNHNLRVYGAVGTLILLGALALNAILKNALSLPGGRWIYRVLIVLLLVFGSWCAKTTYDRVNYQWFDNQVLYLTSARNIAIKESAQGRRVYFSDDVFGVEETVICEGLTVHHLYQTSVIYRNPRENPQDVSVLIHDFSGGPGKALKDRINREFPEAVWSAENEIQLCRIPYTALLKKKQTMFVVRDEPKSVWKREFIRNECGIIFDLINYEDRVSHVTDPISPEYASIYAEAANAFVEAVRYSTVIHVAHEGDYVVHYKAMNRSYLKIDDKMISDLYFFKLLGYMAPEKEGDETVHLIAGDHRVEVVTAFQRTTRPPEFWLRAKGADAPGVSLWSSFNF